MSNKRTLFFVLLLGIICTRDGFGQSDELHELSIEELMQAQVISSTQTYVRLPEAPSSVFVITGDQIRRWGIRRISELLERLGAYRRGEFIAGKDVNDDLNYFVSAGGLAADGYDNNDNGELNISRFPASWRFYGNVNYKRWDFMSRYTRSARALYVLPSTTFSPDRWTNFDTFFANMRRSFDLSDTLRLNIDVSYDTIQTQRHDFRSDLKIRAVGEERYGAKLINFYSGWDHHEIALGTTYRRDEFGPDWAGDNFNFSPLLVNGVAVNIPTDLHAIRNFTPYGRNAYSIFGQDSIEFGDKLSTLVGFRFDRVEAPQIRHPNIFTPRLAFVYTPNKQTVLKAILTSGAGVRVSNAANLSADPINLGTPMIY
jgi:TonB dependent receptor-like, beta-barrel